MKVTDKHVFFYSWRDPFSNHYQSSMPFGTPIHEQEGVSFRTGEHMMMYEKAMLFGDVETAKEILSVYRAQDAKMLGRKVKGFNNKLWDDSKEKIVERICYCRLVYDTDLRRSAIIHRLRCRNFVEASDRDRIWGIGMNEDHPMIHDERNWLGQNLLGKAWDRAIDSLVEKCGGYGRVEHDFKDLM